MKEIRKKLRGRKDSGKQLRSRFMKRESRAAAGGGVSSNDEPRQERQRRAKKSNAPRGFDRGLEPERIIGASDTGGCLTFLIQLKGSDTPELVSSKIANAKAPDLAIRFYEQRLACSFSQ